MGTGVVGGGDGLPVYEFREEGFRLMRQSCKASCCWGLSGEDVGVMPCSRGLVGTFPPMTTPRQAHIARG